MLDKYWPPSSTIAVCVLQSSIFLSRSRLEFFGFGVHWIQNPWWVIIFYFLYYLLIRIFYVSLLYSRCTHVFSEKRLNKTKITFLKCWETTNVEKIYFYYVTIHTQKLKIFERFLYTFFELYINFINKKVKKEILMMGKNILNAISGEKNCFEAFVIKIKKYFSTTKIRIILIINFNKNVIITKK
jgi:hypothetical protein